MKTFVSFVLVMVVGAMARAENSVGDALETKIVKQKIVATLKAGFHFNEKAPNAAVVDGKRVEPTTLSRQKIVIPVPTVYTLAQATLFVCDDALTFCEPKTVDFRGTAEANAYMTARAEMKRAQPKEIKKKRSKINKHGFIEDNLDQAAEQAKKNNSLILVDFSARWCPGCIRLENEILGTKEFKTASKSFVKVKLDYDRFETLPLKSKYAIFGIPTLIVLNADLEEVSRIVDYQPLPILKEFLADAKKTPTAIEKLRAQAAVGDNEANLAIGLRLYSANRFEESLPYLEKVKPTPIQYLDAKVRAAEDSFKESSGRRSSYVETVTEALKAEPNSSRSILWRTGLLAAIDSPAEKKSIAAAGIVVADDLLAHPQKVKDAIKGDFIGEFAGYERLLIAMNRAELIEASGASEDEIKAARAKVTAVGRELNIPISRKGPALRLLIAMGEAKEYKDGEIQARKLLKADPKNPELQRRLLRMLNGQEKFAEAVQVGRKALSKSYGKNEVWVAQQLAKAYTGNHQLLEARALARSYLERTDIDWKAMPAEQKDLQAIIQEATKG